MAVKAVPPRIGSTRAARRRWRRWLDRIYNDVLGLVLKREIYRQVGKIIDQNPRIQLESSFYSWMSEVYAAAMAIGVRRQLDRDSRSISMQNLLREIRQCPGALSRSSYVAHARRDPYLRDALHRQFDRLAGARQPHISLRAIATDLTTLERKLERISFWVNKRIAHSGRRGPSRPPTFAELNECVDLLVELAKRFLLLLRCRSYSFDITWQFDWTQIFRHPWIEVEHAEAGHRVESTPANAGIAPPSRERCVEHAAPSVIGPLDSAPSTTM